jgi:hypothetical protein
MNNTTLAILLALGFFFALELVSDAEAKQRIRISYTVYEGGCFDIKYNGKFHVRCA